MVISFYLSGIWIKLPLLNPGKGAESNLGDNVSIGWPAFISVGSSLCRSHKIVHHWRKLARAQSRITRSEFVSKFSSCRFIAVDSIEMTARAENWSSDLEWSQNRPRVQFQIFLRKIAWNQVLILSRIFYTLKNWKPQIFYGCKQP